MARKLREILERYAEETFEVALARIGCAEVVGNTWMKERERCKTDSTTRQAIAINESVIGARLKVAELAKKRSCTFAEVSELRMLSQQNSTRPEINDDNGDDESGEAFDT